MPKPAAPEFAPAMQLALVANTCDSADPWLSIPARATGWVPVFVGNCPPAHQLAGPPHGGLEAGAPRRRLLGRRMYRATF